ncbi:MAG TPA: competence/damage-inducible protein A [Chloroflexia bacterium]|nr:competence/damage-inducible protein A [Chloroflexia bacterium]
MKAEILSIGTELLLGQITDTNAAWLAQQLPALGIDLFFISQVGDNRGRLTETIGRAHGRADLVICTGGLGPTEDDLTREAISDLLNEPMEVQPELETTLREFFKGRGLQMPERNVKQATLIRSAQALDNPVGTAPGWWVEHDSKIIVCMPGVPHEMKTMWANQVVPRLRERLPGSIILSRTLKVLGKGESAVEEMVHDLIASTNPTLATYAKNDGIHLRVTAKAEDEATARDQIFEMEMKVRERLGTLIYGQDDETIEGVIGEMLMDRSMSLAVMEAGTGGVVSALLSEAPESFNFFRGGLVSQQRVMLAGWGVDRELIEEQGVVSREVAEAMATAARQTLGVEAGLAICAAAGPEPFEGQPPGRIYMAVDLAGTIKSTEGNYRTNPAEVKRLAAVFALNLLRKALLK